MICKISTTKDKSIEIRDTLGPMKEPAITVTVPSVVLYDLTFDEFDEMVRDYAKKRVENCEAPK